VVAPVPPALFAQVLAPLQKYRKCRRHVGPTVVDSPPKLHNVLVQTGARRKQGRLVIWDQQGSWQKIRESKYADTEVDFF